MKRRKTNRTVPVLLLISGVLVVIGLAVAIHARLSLTSVGIEDVASVTDLRALDVQIGYRSGQDGKAETLCTHYRTEGQQYVDMVCEAPTALVVVPLDDFHQYRGSFSQRVRVEQVIHSMDVVKPGDEITIFRSGGLVNRDGIVTYDGTDNVLLPEQGYLVFLESSELNAYTDEQSYSELGTTLDIIPLNRERPPACTSMDYSAYAQYAVFCADASVVDALYDLQDTVLEQYSVDNVGQAIISRG